MSSEYLCARLGGYVTRTALPFICKTCRHRYGDDIFIFEGDASNVSFANNRAQCPRCGTMNRQALPDGTYNIRGGRWEVARQVARDILSAESTVDDIERLAQLLKAAQTLGTDAEQVASEIENETPFAELAKF